MADAAFFATAEASPAAVSAPDAGFERNSALELLPVRSAALASLAFLLRPLLLF